MTLANWHYFYFCFSILYVALVRSRATELRLITQCKLKFMSSRLDYPHATLNVAFSQAAGKVFFLFAFALLVPTSFAQNGQLESGAERTRARQMEGNEDNASERSEGGSAAQRNLF